jgi:hypothetical protein
MHIPSWPLPVLAALFLFVGCDEGDPVDNSLSTGDTEAADTGEDVTTVEDALPEDAPVTPTPCKPGEKSCIMGKVATCDAQFGWLLEACEEGKTCVEGECLASECEALTARCFEDGVQICSPDGLGWSTVMPCPQGKVCVEGSCVDPKCKPGESQCSGDTVITCSEDGSAWLATPCAEGEVCFDGECIECVEDADCAPGEVCNDGICVAEPLEILTNSLPDGVQAEPYETTLEGTGGTPPYAWSLAAGTLPQGLELKADGTLSGTPEEHGDFSVTVELADDADGTVSKEFSFSVVAAAATVMIKTGSPLPSGLEGEPYSTALEAAGGTPPYFWGISAGELPAGLTLTSAGTIEGTPAAHGTFTFTVKVFDNGEQVGTGSKEFELTIKVAPLEILGDTMYDIWITKIIVLPLITTVDVIPIPYSVDLQAKGGVKPYHWAEEPIPDFVNYLIKNGGIPEGLTLEEDGQLHGSTTDTSKVVNLKIPFTGIDLTGYFFTARVEDSQDPADSDWAIYLIPTVPIAW